MTIEERYLDDLLNVISNVYLKEPFIHQMRISQSSVEQIKRIDILNTGKLELSKIFPGVLKDKDNAQLV